MARFFIHRPIVAIVISIIIVIVGVVTLRGLPVSLFPNIAPPEISLQGSYVGADAQTIEQSIATPIEQQMSGVEDMLYMYSINSSTGNMRLNIDFDISTNPNMDQVLAQLRYAQAESRLPLDFRNYGITLRKSTGSPLALVALYSPKGTYDALFLANYAYINLYDPMSRVPGIGQVSIFGAGQYAMRLWVSPDVLAKFGITVSDILDAISQQNTVNPAGQVGAPPLPPGQEFTYTVRAQGRLQSPEEFQEIIIRANLDGSMVKIKDVARVELGAQVYSMEGRLNGKPSAIIALYQLPGANALETLKRAKAFMEEAKKRFPSDIDYMVSLDTTRAVTEGIREILYTLFEALFLVVLVVFIFLQGWRATLIPLLAVPVSLVGAFVIFPFLGFSINTLSLFGLVLAIGLVVDDAIVVVEAVEHHIEEGLSPREATIKAMEEVSGPVIAIALILCAVFIPTAFIPGITGRLYQQFAATIAISVVLSAFNALTLSPALSALLLRPKKEAPSLARRFFGAFNRWFSRATDKYVSWSGYLIQKASLAGLLLVAFTLVAGFIGARLPRGFLPEEDQGYFYVNVQLPPAASLERTSAVCREVEKILQETPGVQNYNTVVGFSLLSLVNTTYNGFFFVTLKPWRERDSQGLIAQNLMRRLNQELAHLPDAISFTFSPPAIPGIGTSGGVTFMLEDRSGGDIKLLTENTNKFLAAARQRPEFSALSTTFLPDVPQLFANVNREKVLKLQIPLSSVYKTLQSFMGGYFVNYFNEFGHVWQVYVQAEGEYRTQAEKVGQFFVRSANGEMAPLSTLMNIRDAYGPEFLIHYNGYRAAQILGTLAPGYSSNQGMKALEEVFAQTMPSQMGYDYMGMSYQEKVASQGVSPILIFGFSLLMVFLILAAQYESWTLPFSVLLTLPVAVCGAFTILFLRGFINNVYAQIGLVMMIGLSAKNAILIVEFSKREVERGASITEAALAGARLRLRPILMTAFAFILGVVPLVIATGAGAQARQTLGTTVIGGMTAASLIAIFLIPASFSMIEHLSHREEPLPRRQNAEHAIPDVAD